MLKVAGSLQRASTWATTFFRPRLASHWVGLVTPVDAGVAKPLVGSLVHEVVCQEHDLEALVGPPEGGVTPYREAVRLAMHGVEPDPHHAVRLVLSAAAAGAGLVLLAARAARRRR